jgi:hypothetical protein
MDRPIAWELPHLVRVHRKFAIERGLQPNPRGVGRVRLGDRLVRETNYSEDAEAALSKHLHGRFRGGLEESTD